MIPAAFIQDLLNRIDIVEVLGRYLKLKKGGINFMGLCPFHHEKSPSFTVSPTKQFYHCFGCGAHGSAISFLIEYAGLSFPDAVKDLAQSVGMTVPEEDQRLAPEQRAQYQAQSLALSEVLMRANQFYRQQLRSAPHAIDYLKRRGLSGAIAAHFALGYAPDDWQALQVVFDDYHDNALVDAGLVIIKEDEQANTQRRYDRFRDRIMFPIRNSKGQVIGFGGRVLEQGEPKYLNSPETALFQKGNELYGLFEARQAIREAQCVIVVEGYMDVVALAQHGVANVVATLGTACSTTHMQKLLRQTDHVVFSFDGDAAGRKAAWRALEASLPYAQDNKSLRFLFLPPEHDPDSYIREFGREKFQEQIRQAVPLSAWLLKSIASANDLTTPEGRAKAQFDAKPLMRLLPEGALRLQILRELAQLTRSSVDELIELFQLTTQRRQVIQKYARGQRPTPVGLMRQALQTLMLFPAIAARLTTDDVEALISLDTQAQDLLQEVLAVCRDGKPDFWGLADQLRESSNAVFFETLMQEILAFDENKRDLLLYDPNNPEHVEQRDAHQELKFAELRGAIVKAQITQINQQLADLAQGGLTDPANAARYRELFAQQNALKKSR